MKTIEVYSRKKGKYSDIKIAEEFEKVLKEVGYQGERYIPIQGDVLFQVSNLKDGLAKKIVEAFNETDDLYAKITK